MKEERERERERERYVSFLVNALVFFGYIVSVWGFVACFLLAGVRRGTVTLDLYLFRFRDLGEVLEIYRVCGMQLAY
jgi:hypothetical protein